MGNAGNEKQAGQTKGGATSTVTCLDCEGTGRRQHSTGWYKCPRCEGRGTETVPAPVPPSAEKPLPGEPTARMLIEQMASENDRLIAALDELFDACDCGSGVKPTCFGAKEGAAGFGCPECCDHERNENDHDGWCVPLRPTPEQAILQTEAAARAYLSTRAPAEEEALAALRNYGAALRSRYGPLARDAIASATSALAARALALPVEGRAPDASHEKKLGKKGGGS